MGRGVVHIVDDDHQVRASTSFLLRTLGYHTEVYDSGEELLRCSRLVEGCILLDLRMPGLSGMEVQEELVRRGQTLPVVMLSGHGDIATAVQAVRTGAVDFLEKPYSETQLVAAIERALEQQTAVQEADAALVEAKARLATMSPRQIQVLRGLLGGMGNKQIAHLLHLSVRTVESHRARLTEDLGRGALPKLIKFALDVGLVPLSEDERVVPENE